MIRKHLISLGLFCLLATAACAENLSFQGVFQTDNDVQLFNFTIGSTRAVTFLTLSYAGGTNSQGTVIPAGGFDPLLTLFDPSGIEVGSFDNGTAGQVGLGPDGYLDSYDVETLPAGTYTLALTESPNGPQDEFLSDGFTGGGPFYSCTNDASFCDAVGTALNGNWAVDIRNVDGATEQGTSTVPEPASLLLVSTCLGVISRVRRRWLSRA
jgi:hypothetical protein